MTKKVKYSFDLSRGRWFLVEMLKTHARIVEYQDGITAEYSLQDAHSAGENKKLANCNGIVGYEVLPVDYEWLKTARQRDGIISKILISRRIRALGLSPVGNGG